MLLHGDREMMRTRLAHDPSLGATEGHGVVPVVDAFLIYTLDVAGLPCLAPIKCLEQRLLCSGEEAVLWVRTREGNVKQHNSIFDWQGDL